MHADGRQSLVAACMGAVLIQALQAILAGSRDPNLASAPNLDITLAAEIILLIETLGKPA